jgi:hypothetical protein
MFNILREDAMKLSPYINLIRSFLNGEIAVTDFERRYMRLFKDDNTKWSQTEYEVLNELFSDIDAFCADPRLRRSGDLDEPQLRKKSEIALKKLLTLNGVPA